MVAVDKQPGNAKPDKTPSLKPVFAKNGTVTPANSSSISNGAAALVLTRVSMAKRLGMPVFSRVLSTTCYAHERMHGTLNRAVGQHMRDASALRQQQALATFRNEYNILRSHENLGRRPPASCYTRPPRAFSPVLQPVSYDDDDQQVRIVRYNGEMKFKGGLIYLSKLLAKQPVGLRQIDEQRYEVRLSFHLLGYLNLATRGVEKTMHWHGSMPDNV